MTDNLIKVSFNATGRAVAALQSAADHANLSRTDTLNRAVQVYAGITRLSLWQAIRLVLAERATVRRFAAEQGGQWCEICEQEIQPGETIADQPGTGGLVQHVTCPAREGTAR